MIPFKRQFDLFISFIVWLFFLLSLSFLFLIYPALLLISLFLKDNQILYRSLIHYYLKLFFRFSQFVVPGQKVLIDEPEKIKNIKSSIILCNHLSYLDGLLILSLNRQTVTLAKSQSFKFPVIGWIMYQAGYLRSGAEDGESFINDQNRLKCFLDQGGNILLFPEGTRSKSGQLLPFKKGSFNLAKRLESPVELLFIENSQLHFNTVLYSSFVEGKIKIKSLACVNPSYCDPNFSVRAFKNEVYQLYEKEVQSLMKESNVSRFYNDLAEDYDLEQDSQKFAFVREPEKEIVFSKIYSILHKDHAVLEIGAGTGRFSLEIAPRVNRLVALDLSASMLSRLQSKMRDQHITNVEVVKGNFLDSPFTHQFDVIVSFSAIEYINDKEVLFKKMGDLVVDQGYILITTAQKSFFRFFGRLGNYFRQDVIMNAFSKKELKQLLEKNQFEIIEMEDLCLKSILTKGILLLALAQKKVRND